MSAMQADHSQARRMLGSLGLHASIAKAGERRRQNWDIIVAPFAPIAVQQALQIMSSRKVEEA